MEDSLAPYREAIATSVHAVCWDRNLDPHSPIDTEASCRIERLLPEVVRLVRAVGPTDFATFEEAFMKTICVQCGHRDATGTCRVQERAECCLYRYLPLVYDAILRVHQSAS